MPAAMRRLRVDQMVARVLNWLIALACFAATANCASPTDRPHSARSAQVRHAPDSVEEPRAPGPKVSAPTRSAHSDTEQPHARAAQSRKWACYVMAFHERATCPPGAPCHYKSPPTTRDWFRFVGEVATSEMGASQSARARLRAENEIRRERYNKAMRAFSQSQNANLKVSPTAQPALKTLTAGNRLCVSRPLDERMDLPKSGRAHACNSISATPGHKRGTNAQTTSRHDLPSRAGVRPCRWSSR